MKKLLLLGMVSLFFFSCSEEHKIQKVERAFYYWKSSYIDSGEKTALKLYHVKKVYVKYFEIDYSEAMGNYPLDKTDAQNLDTAEFDSLSIVPTVFIKNEIFQYNSESDLQKLADNIVFLIDKYSKQKFEKSTIANEIQIDCDWTKTNKDKYFKLLKAISEISKRDISCTLRLYPYKYPEIMGTPPVDKVTLMCYNLVKPLSDDNKNSILDLNELESYLNLKKEYPLPLDVALPIYSWTHWYQNSRFEGLLTLGSKEIKTFAKPTKPMWYEVTKDTTLNYETYFRKGDQLKCEEVDAKLIAKAIAIIKKNVVLKDGCTISLFHLDEHILNQYSNEEIDGFYTAFTK
jgi:cytochrome b involved in lipid metabolism